MDTQQMISLNPVRYQQWQIPAEIKSKPLRKKSPEFYLTLAMVIDLVLLNLCILGLLQINGLLDSLLTNNFLSFLSFFLIFNLLGIVIASWCNVFQITDIGTISMKIRNLFVAVLAYIGVMGTIYYYVYLPVFGFNLIPPAAGLFFVFATFTHFVVRYKTRNMSGFLTYAVVGGRPANLSFLGKIFSSVYGEHAVCLGRFANIPISGVKSLGSYGEVKEYIKQSDGLNKLLYINSNLSENEIHEVIQLCRSRFISFEVVPEAVNFFKNGLHVEQISQLPVFSRKKTPLGLLNNKILKRSFDILFSSLVLVTIYPILYTIIAILIKLESRGPVYFKQKRTGYWNKPFTCYKFRTMSVNNNSDKLQAVKSDPRITRIGAFLRKSSLDEFPQFINVFRGEMSVVGPRPHMLKHTEDYSKLIDTFMIRHEVKPGITGWAQVNGWRGPTDKVYKMAKRVEFDVEYIENWSFWFDCKCIIMTVLNVVKGDSNAF